MVRRHRREWSGAGGSRLRLVVRWRLGWRFGSSRMTAGTLTSSPDVQVPFVLLVRPCCGAPAPAVTTTTDRRRWLVSIRRNLVTGRIAQQNGSRQTRVYRGFGAFDDPSPGGGAAHDVRWRRECVKQGGDPRRRHPRGVRSVPTQLNADPQRTYTSPAADHGSAVAMSRSADQPATPRTTTRTPHNAHRPRRAEAPRGR